MNDTVRSYDRDAATYVASTAVMPDSVRTRIEDLAARLGPAGRVLEVGSGGGRDALAMERLGLVVRRTDITPGFVELLRERGHACDLVDPRVDDLSSPDGPYDAVWANASLLHVARQDLPTVLSRLAAVVRDGGLLRISLKEGDGDGWSTHGSIRSPRHFTYWRADDLRTVVEGAGWTDVSISTGVAGQRGETWLEVSAVCGSVTR
jgi:2-polyprenyl-3-methyl-5-hydroxy-6-metoxy-1,4-benzoquinol methylase